MLWQASPGKQWCLNRCHRRVQLAAFGAAADRDTFVFGPTHGGSYVGACWALMLLPLSVANLHVPVMAAVALFVAAERVERPAPARLALAVAGQGPSNYRGTAALTFSAA